MANPEHYAWVDLLVHETMETWFQFGDSGLREWKKRFQKQVAKGKIRPAEGSLDLSGADMSQWHFRGKGWEDSLLENANFRGAVLKKAAFFNVSLAGADFSGANMRKCAMEHCRLDGATFREADLRKAACIDLGEDECGPPPDFTDANLKSTVFLLKGPTRAVFAGAKMTDCRIALDYPMAGTAEGKAALEDVFGRLSPEQQSKVEVDEGEEDEDA
jgi:uncharacterized protein YjbI with pentapeptide repeats